MLPGGTQLLCLDDQGSWKPLFPVISTTVDHTCSLYIPVLIDAEKDEQLPKPVRKEKNDNIVTPNEPSPCTYAVFNQ
jgi:hypothetical protein